MMGKVPQSLASVSRGGEAHGNRWCKPHRPSAEMMDGWRKCCQTVSATHPESEPLRTRSPAGATRRARTNREKCHKSAENVWSHWERATLWHIIWQPLCGSAAYVTCEVTPQSTRCCSSSLSWWARTFSAMFRMFSGGLGKYSNQCWHQFTAQPNNWVSRDSCERLSWLKEKRLLHLDQIYIVFMCARVMLQKHTVMMELCRKVPMTVATTSKQSIGLFWKSLTKGKATRGRYSTSPKMAAQWAKADNTLWRQNKQSQCFLVQLCCMLIKQSKRFK